MKEKSKPQYRHTIRDCVERLDLGQGWVEETNVGTFGDEVDIVQTLLYNDKVMKQNAIHFNKKFLEKIK